MIHHTGMNNDILDMIQKTQATQAKINKYIKLGSSAWPRKQTE
jgi:hypothetical protein